MQGSAGEANQEQVDKESVDREKVDEARGSGEQLGHTEAEQAVLTDLINAMLHENLLGILQKGEISKTWRLAADLNRGSDRNHDFVSSPEQTLYPLDERESYFYLPIDDKRVLMFRVHSQPFIQSYKISRLPVVLLSMEAGSASVQVEECDTITFMKIWTEALTEEERKSALPNLPDFLAELKESIQHHALSWQALQAYEYGENGSMLHAEQFSAFRDRPFHPTSRAKRGWNDGEYRLYSSEFGQSFGLDWVAVRRDYLQVSTSEEAWGDLLDTHEQEQLLRAAQEAGVADEAYTLLPVHPWQMEHVLSEVYREEMEQRIIVLVIRGLGNVRATSSVRALATSVNEHLHVKVPLGIYSLGALRIMPPRYLHNGAEGQHLLARIKEKDAFLQNGLRVCDETKWWAFHDPAGDAFADKPGHLGCLIREYPQDLLDDPQTEVITMSALAVLDRERKNPILERWIDGRFGDGANVAGTNEERLSTKRPASAHILQLFSELSRTFLETTLRCFRYGIMPEVHGQNVMLIFRDGKIQGMLLRDHDTIRLHLPWLQREGVAAPNYTVKPGTPNSLMNDTPEKLLSYLQTLGLQVNLYAVVDAWSRAYEIEEALFWQVIKQEIEACLTDVDFPADVRETLAEQLLDSATWPTRLLIGPLLKRQGSGGGSMPADAGFTQNPLQQIGVGYGLTSVLTQS